MENADCLYDWLAGVGVVIIEKKLHSHNLLILRRAATWGLCGVACCCCWVRPLQIFLMAPSLRNRRLLRLAQWPRSVSGLMGAKEAWENQFMQGSAAKTQCRTRAGVGLCQINIGSLRGVWTKRPVTGSGHNNVIVWSEWDLCDFIGQSPSECI